MTFSGNQFVNCSIDIVGYELTNFSTHVISADNTVNGRPILFYEGLENLVLDGVDAGEVIIVGCRNVVVSNMTFYRGFAGVIVAYSSEATVENNVFTSCWIGTRVRGCSGVVVRGNNLTEVVGQGIGIWNTEGATVEDNELSSLGTFRYQDLMPIFHSSYVSLVNNTLTDSWQGVTAYFCSNLFISGNFISCMLSEGMHIGYSSVIEIIDSMFTGNGVGLSLEVCTGAKTYHNDFIGNTVQASDVNGTNNVWDNGYPGGGNYWNDYTGVDENGDGIGDTPYLIEGGAQDNYPLMTIYYAGWVAND
jgi:parallel beta-helix repeat protein